MLQVYCIPTLVSQPAHRCRSGLLPCQSPACTPMHGFMEPGLSILSRYAQRCFQFCSCRWVQGPSAVVIDFLSSCNHRIVVYSAASSQNRRSILADIKEPDVSLLLTRLLGAMMRMFHPPRQSKTGFRLQGEWVLLPLFGFVNNLHGICTNTSDFWLDSLRDARLPRPLFTLKRKSLAARRSGNNMHGPHEGSFRIRSAADALLHRALISRLMEPSFTSSLLQSLCAVLHFGFSANWRGRYGSS